METRIILLGYLIMSRFKFFVGSNMHCSLLSDLNLNFDIFYA